MTDNYWQTIVYFPESSSLDNLKDNHEEQLMNIFKTVFFLSNKQRLKVTYVDLYVLMRWLQSGIWILKSLFLWTNAENRNFSKGVKAIQIEKKNFRQVCRFWYFLIKYIEKIPGSIVVFRRF